MGETTPATKLYALLIGLLAGTGIAIIGLIMTILNDYGDSNRTVGMVLFLIGIIMISIFAMKINRLR